MWGVVDDDLDSDSFGGFGVGVVELWVGRMGVVCDWFVGERVDEGVGGVVGMCGEVVLL